MEAVTRLAEAALDGMHPQVPHRRPGPQVGIQMLFCLASGMARHDEDDFAEKLLVSCMLFKFPIRDADQTRSN